MEYLCPCGPILACMPWQGYLDIYERSWGRVGTGELNETSVLSGFYGK